MDNNYESFGGTQTITGTKTCTISVAATVFVKYSGINQQVLLADGTVKPLSEFGGGESTVEYLTSQVAINVTATGFNYSSLTFVNQANLYLYQMQFTPKQEGFAPSMSIKIGTLPTQHAPTVSELWEIRCNSVGASLIEQLSFSGIKDVRLRIS
ncbi:MAG: hypothetical protein EZS28_036454 [Streblomastix strix]|uniref:Uncharacterized protein n=1 Tax=Streblomastix strix TaxID=222440 RepID=A0A5J4UBZ1_9EUKA|nr:MAG: hypothetical protein EZS28_036454 [Streblomastix strix]